MKGGTRKRGENMVILILMLPKSAAKERKSKKADSAPKRKQKRLWQRLSRNMKAPDRSFSLPPSASVIIWTSGMSSIAK